MLRIGVTIGIKKDKIEEYKKLHAKVWPEVLENLTDLNFKNYSIYLHNNMLFGYMEYHGNDIERDNELMANNKKVQEWWRVCSPCHIPDPNRKKGEWWSVMEEVFHHE
jgi:L-rhamnose mutarotase